MSRSEDLAVAIASRLSARGRSELPSHGLLPAAVALPLVSMPQGVAVLFTVRTIHVEHHKGEISFPGGRVSPGDRDTLTAALRETEEEVGIRREDLRVLGPLDEFASVTGYRVSPHVVYLDRPAYPFLPEPNEVAEILLVPLAHLLDRSHYHTVRQPAENAHPVHHFRWGPHVVWGLTAAILKRFLEIVFRFDDPS